MMNNDTKCLINGIPDELPVPNHRFSTALIDHEPMSPFDAYDVGAVSFYDGVGIQAAYMRFCETYLLTQDLDHSWHHCDETCNYCSKPTP